MERKLKDTLAGGRFEGLTAAQSERMRAVKGRGNKSTEKRLRALLVRASVRGWKLHPRDIVGKPDFYFPDARLAVFVDGCFWHGCPVCGHLPRANAPYWKAKIEGNQRRDRANDERLGALGIEVTRVWEHELAASPRAVVARIQALAAGAPPKNGSGTAPREKS